MARFIAKRLALGLITLFLLSVLVFCMANVLPGNVGRRVLGPFASPTAVAALNHQLGTDQPVLKQYWNQMKGYVHGDMGRSVSTRQPI
ncbi:MAG: peptide/nickel transport system permease protein, partial [Solirubrobacteraceae bacterium]